MAVGSVSFHLAITSSCGPLNVCMLILIYVSHVVRLVCPEYLALVLVVLRAACVRAREQLVLVLFVLRAVCSRARCAQSSQFACTRARRAQSSL